MAPKACSNPSANVLSNPDRDPKTFNLAVSTVLLRLQEKQKLQQPSSASDAKDLDPQAFKLAFAVALLRTRERQKQQRSVSSTDDATHWKQKAKRRKQELLRLREELKLLEDGAATSSQGNAALPEIVCRCHFFDGCDGLGPKRARDGSTGVGANDAYPVSDVLRRWFLRHVRWSEQRKRAAGLSRGIHLIEPNLEDGMEQLSRSADFLVELSDTISSGRSTSSVTTLSHQAIDFISASLKSLLSLKKDTELVEEIVSSLILRLIKRMSSQLGHNESLNSSSDCQFYVQHLVRKLGKECFIGQRILFLVSQRICTLSENLLTIDPFDDAFPDIHDLMFMMIQLTEHLISDNIQAWTSNEDFDSRLLEEWVRSVLQARQVLGLLESRNGLYSLYMSRITGELAKALGSLPQPGLLNEDVLSQLLC